MKNNHFYEFEELINNEYKNMAGIIIRNNDDLIFEKYFQVYNREAVVCIASDKGSNKWTVNTSGF